MIKIKNKLLAAALCAMVAASGLTVASAPAADAATSCVYQTFSYDVQHSKACVKYFQQLSNAIAKDSAAAGYFDNPKYKTFNDVVGVGQLDPDGKLGNLTKTAITKWQKHGWYMTKGVSGFKPMSVDGIIGKQTWELMCVLGDPAWAAYKNAGCSETDDWYLLPGYPGWAELRIGTHS